MQGEQDTRTSGCAAYLGKDGLAVALLLLRGIGLLVVVHEALEEVRGHGGGAGENAGEGDDGVHGLKGMSLID